ncbi:MAG: carboxypeptidase-like regulatory domain-containing protein, partial [Bacteroidetes bacterium]|nr:carboxypeptidase-like regulatory domain-containing protein [Bacteroidota bacterium]
MVSKKLFFSSVILSILIFGFTAPTMAQGSGSIKGKVVDAATGEPLIGGNVVVLNTSIGAATDINGMYFLRVVPAGKWLIRVSYIGYEEATQEVTITGGEALELNFKLTPRAIEGEAVVVTAQMKGQDAAINQQLTSNTIANIVAADRIRELPDVNAAESIGRLPGVAISRSGGEATQVVIRGLSPKYNLVTVNGMPLPATGGDDRSTDLSMISSNMLGGIELKKAMTPDMDADFLGGVVDLKLKEAPENFETRLSIQGGYNKLQDYHKNYNLNASVGNRFFDNKLGILLNLNADNYDRSADKLS